MASVQIRFFGPASELAGRTSERIEIAENETVGMLAGKLADRYEKLGKLLGVRLAVNRAYVPMDHVLTDGDEVAVIPPVSGG